MSSLARFLGIDSWIPGSGLLNGLSAAVQVGAYAPDLLHFTQRETDPIHQLQRAIDTLQRALSSREHEPIQAAAKEAQAQLRAILADQAQYKVNFRNYSSFTSWATYFTPLNNLKEEVNTYLSAHFGHTTDGMAELVVPAKVLVDAEVQKQKGLVAHTLEAALDTVVSRVQDEVSERFGHGQQEQQVVNQAQKLPPLLKLQKQIAYYNSHPDETIPEVVDEELRLALHELDCSSPLFAGVEAAVLHERVEPLTPQEMIDVLNRFLFNIAHTKPDDQLHQFIYLVAQERNVVPQRRITEEKEAQIQWGKDLLEDFETYLNGEGVVPKFAEVLWVAMVQLDELAKLTRVMSDLSMSPTDSLRTLSDKVDQALAFFESNPYSSAEVMHQLATTMEAWLGKIFTLSKDHLEKGDRANLGRLLTQAKRLINQGKHIEALKVLKQGFETDVLATQMGQFDPRSKPQSAVAELVESYEKQSQPQQPNAQRDWQGELNLQRKNLVENLTYFSTFQVMEKVCGRRPSAESEQAFAAIHEAIKDLQGEEKEARFKELIIAEIEKNPNKGFFGKLYARAIVSFVSHVVRYFAEHFTVSLTEHLSSLIHRPHENPLGTDHLSPIQSMNNALVAYLQAEERVSSDPQGREAGGLGKVLRMKHFLEQPDLNGGNGMRELVNKVMDKAIKEFLHLSKPSKASQWNDRLVEWQKGAQSIFGIIGKNGLAYFLRGVLLPIRFISWIGNGIYSKGVKWGSSLLLSQLDIVNSVLESANKALYDNAQFTSSIDEVLLENLRVFEKLLDQEGGEPKLYEGDSGKRLFEELVNNLFSVLDKRGQLTPKQEKRRDNLLVQSKEAIEDMADEKLKQTVRDLLIFVYQSMRTEQHMNSILLTLLKNTNNALLPGKHPIHTLYSAKQKTQIAMLVGARGEEPSTQDLLIHFALFDSGKVSRKELAESQHTLTRALGKEPTKGEFIIYYRGKPEVLAKITRVDLENALKSKYQRAEEEIRVILERILKKSVEDVVVSQAETLLKTPENALIDYLSWMEHQFIPQSVSGQTLQPSYIEVMQSQIALYERSHEPLGQHKHLQNLHSHHLRMMRQMQNSLTMLASKEHSGNSIDNKIRSVYELSERKLFPLLQRISEQILAFQATKKPEHLRALKQLLQGLEQQMQARAGAIHAIKHSLQHEDGSLGEKVRKWKDWAIQGAAEPCVQHITNYVHGRLNKRAQEAIHMYKDPNILPLMMRQVIGLPYLQKPAPSKNARAIALRA